MQEFIDFFVPSPGQRILVTGQTRSGKTYFVERVASTPDRYSIILDVKAEFDYSFFRETEIATTPEAVNRLSNRNVKTIVYQPAEKLLRETSAYNDVLDLAYRRKNTQIIVDEFYALADPDNPRKYPDAMNTILTRGASRNITCYLITQRPSGVPLTSLSEAQIFVSFRLNLPQDRKRMEEVTGQQLFGIGVQNIPIDTQRNGHEFLYYRQEDDYIGIFCLNK